MFYSGTFWCLGKRYCKMSLWGHFVLAVPAAWSLQCWRRQLQLAPVSSLFIHIILLYYFSWWLCLHELRWASPHELCAIFKLGRNVGFVNSVLLSVSQDFLSLACIQLFCWMTLEDLNQVNGLKCYIEVQQEGRTPAEQKHCPLCTSSCQCCHLQLSKFFPARTDFVLLYFPQEGTRCVIAAPARAGL